MRELKIVAVLYLAAAMFSAATEAVAARDPGDPAPLDMYDMAQILDTPSLDPHLLWEDLSPEGVLIRGVDYFAGGWAGIHCQDWVAWVASGYQGGPPTPEPYPWTVQGLLYVSPDCDWGKGYGLVAQTSSAYNDLGDDFWTEYGVETALALDVPVLLIDVPPQDVIDHYGWGDENLLAGASREWVLRIGLPDPAEQARLHLRYALALAQMRGVTLLSTLAGIHGGNLDGGAIVLGSSKRGVSAWVSAAVDERIRGIVSCAADALHMVATCERIIDDWYEDAGGVANAQAQLDGLLDPALHGQLFLDYYDPWTFLQNPEVPQDFFPMMMVGSSDNSYPIRCLGDFLEGGPFAAAWGHDFVPGYEHGCGHMRHVDALRALAAHLHEERALPTVEHVAQVDGLTLTVTAMVSTPNPVTDVELVYATKDSGDRQFIDRPWSTVPMTELGGGTYEASVTLPPAEGWIAFYTQVSDFDAGLSLPAHASSLPEILPGNDATGAADESISSALMLRGNHPNPFNPTTRITFDLPDAAEVRLDIYSTSGRRVATLVDGVMAPGRHDVSWHGLNEAGRAAPSGVYFARLEAAGEVLTHKMALMK